MLKSRMTKSIKKLQSDLDHMVNSQSIFWHQSDSEQEEIVGELSPPNRESFKTDKKSISNGNTIKASNEKFKKSQTGMFGLSRLNTIG